MGKKDGRPRGKTTAYAYFVQTCREELKKKNPSETVVFAEFSKKCGEKWKAMSAKDKKRFDDMATKDKARFDKEMSSYTPADGEKKKGKKKDPNAPKRALSAFFCFCNEERSKVKAKYPSYTVGDIAKELGKRWEVCTNRPKFEEIAAQDKKRYEKEMSAYKSGGVVPKKVTKPAAKPAAKSKKPVEESEEEEDEDDEEEDEDDDDDE